MTTATGSVFAAPEAMIPPLPQDRAIIGGPAVAPQSFGAPGQPAASGIPIFELVAQRQADGTYRNVEYVTIKTPGDVRAMPRRKVTDGLRDKYRTYYDRFRQGLEMAPDGAPLEMWPVLSPAQVLHLKSLNVFTVEQLAEMADANLGAIPMGRTLKNQAIAWLGAKQKADTVENARRENETLRMGMSMLEEQNQALVKRLEALETASRASEAGETGDAPKRRGRPPNPPRDDA